MIDHESGVPPLQVTFERQQARDDYESTRPRIPKAGPNSWDEVKDGDFGRFFDFRVEPMGDYTIIHPDSWAALQWCYAHLPEDAPRYGPDGYKIETPRVGEIVNHMEEDRLISEDEYVQRMLLDEETRRQHD